MIEYWPSRNYLDDAYKKHLQLVTQNVKTTSSQRADEHFTALAKSKRIKGGNTNRGTWLELCIYDALACRGISPNRIAHSAGETYKITKINRNSKAEVDIIVTPGNGGRPYCFYCKSSIRERWAQADRAAMIVKQGNFRAIHILLTIAEAPGEPVEKITARLRKLSTSFVGLDKIISIRQYNEWGFLLEEIVNQ